MTTSKKQPPRALVEIFGHSPLDTTPMARKFWDLSACPFIGKACTKFDHTKTICYGTCSVKNSGNDVVICPNRLYANNYKTLRKVSKEVFRKKTFLLFDEYIKKLTAGDIQFDCVVALGQNSGKEVKISNMSMD